MDWSKRMISHLTSTVSHSLHMEGQYVCVAWKKKLRAISCYLACYSVFGESTLNFRSFARYGAICNIACYIALKYHSVSAISNIARYLFVGLGVELASIWWGCGVNNIWRKSRFLNMTNHTEKKLCVSLYPLFFLKFFIFWAIFKYSALLACYSVYNAWRRARLKKISHYFFHTV
jgi:hypothetical protein